MDGNLVLVQAMWKESECLLRVLFPYTMIVTRQNKRYYKTTHTQDKTRPDNTRQRSGQRQRQRQNKTRQNKTRHNMTRQDKTRQDTT